MSRIVSTLLALLFLAARAPADLGPLEPLADLHRAVHESLGLPEPLIVRLLERGLPDDELPVVGLIAARASVSAESVATLRLGGMSFVDLTLHFGLGPEIYYVPFEVDPGPPYGNAWGYYRKTPRAEWRTLRLPDADIVNYANLRLCVDRYQVAPLEVVVLRKGGKGFAVIHRDIVAKGKAGKAAKSSAAPAAKKAKDSKKAKEPKGAKKGKPPVEAPLD